MGRDLITQLKPGLDATGKKVKHGTKVCSDKVQCDAQYKLNYVASVNDKTNHLTNTDLQDSTILLVHLGLGFRWGYLRQLWHRACKCAVSGGAEVATILLTHPEYKPAYGQKTGGVDQDNSAERIRLEIKPLTSPFSMMWSGVPHQGKKIALHIDGRFDGTQISQAIIDDRPPP